MEINMWTEMVIGDNTMGYRQAERHSNLTAAYAGSNPASPVSLVKETSLYEKIDKKQHKQY